MIKINEVPNYYEPREKIIQNFKTYLNKKDGPWMAISESAFICGLLDKAQPKKILEVGVAKGGTTAMALHILQNIGKSYEMHSVDLASDEGIGHLATVAKEHNLFISPPPVNFCGNHEFYLGKYLPQVIDEIGDDIDFVILDTIHYTPGELLDFIAMLPYLKNDAIVVLHDISLNQKNVSWHKPDAHATGLLFATVVAKEKFLNYEPEKTYPNIGAFRISEQTRENIENVFLALMLTWHYLPKDNQINIYRDFYNRHYPAKLVEIFDETVRLNRNNVAFKK